jgi:hypothetical protein
MLGLVQVALRRRILHALSTTRRKNPLSTGAEIPFYALQKLLSSHAVGKTFCAGSMQFCLKVSLLSLKEDAVGIISLIYEIDPGRYTL